MLTTPTPSPTSRRRARHAPRLWLLLGALIASTSCANDLASNSDDTSLTGAQEASAKRALALLARDASDHSTQRRPLNPGDHARAQAASHRDGVTIVDMDIDHAAARAATETLALSDDNRARLAAATVPLLLPRDLSLRRDLLITHGRGWTAGSMQGDGVHISVHAHGRAHVHPTLASELARAKEAAGGEGAPRTSRAHMITSVSFERFGASYVLDVECAKPGQDPRCADEGYALEIFESLVMAGGAK